MKSIIALPDDYTVIDLETTGTKAQQDEIIEISAIRYRDNAESARYSKLIKPQASISSFVSLLTGITNSMVEGSPSIDDEILNFAEFIGNDILVGHNIAGFDTNFLAQAYKRCLNRTLENDCIDTFRIAKRLYPGLPKHTLEFISWHLNVEQSGAHRGLMDCETANACYQKMKIEILANSSEQELKDLFKKKTASEQVAQIKPHAESFDENNPLYKKNIVFTGAMLLTRTQAIQLAVDVGAIVKPSVTTKTDFLVVGVQDTDRVGDDGMSSKEEKAYALNSSGKANISIIKESDFLKMVNR